MRLLIIALLLVGCAQSKETIYITNTEMLDCEKHAELYLCTKVTDINPKCNRDEDRGRDARRDEYT